MFFDPMPLLLALAALTLGPLLIGVVLRLIGLRRAARVAAVITALVCVGFGSLLYVPGGQGWIFVVGQLLAAIGLWFGSAPDPEAEAPA